MFRYSAPSVRFPYFPLGNTPATCLTRYIPRSPSADILCLGAGDLRNVLFTVFSEPGRKLDFTICDHSGPLITRNITLLSMIMDDQSGRRQDTIFDLTYNVYVRSESRNFLRQHSQKLCKLMKDQETWNKSSYGRCIRFGDKHTFNTVKAKLRTFLAPSDLKDRKEHKAMLDRSLSLYPIAVYRQDIGINYPDRFSVLPYTSSEKHVNAWDKLWHALWSEGSLDSITTRGHPDKVPNTLLSPGDNVSYVASSFSPLLGFHMGLVRLPMEFPIYPTTSPATKRNWDQDDTPDQVLSLAKAQYSAWCHALRQSLSIFKYRVIHGDAIAFGYTLQNVLATEGKSLNANWYRFLYGFQPFLLEGGDYDDTAKSVTPLQFDVIDTSNLMDHIGALNLLLSAGPLLKQDGGRSAITMETMTNIQGTQEKATRYLLGGEANLMSGLLGFILCEWTANNNSSLAYEWFMDNEIMSICGRVRFTWRRLPDYYTRPEMDDDEWVKILAEIQTFLHPRCESKFDLNDVAKGPRSSPVTIILIFEIVKRIIGRERTREVWRKFLLEFSSYKHTDRLDTANEIIIYGESYTPGIVSIDDPSSSQYETKSKALVPVDSRWVTLTIPRDRLAVILDAEDPHQVILQIVSIRHGYTFSALQIGFGRVITTGTRGQESYSVNIVDQCDPLAENMPMLVSFLAAGDVYRDGIFMLRGAVEPFNILKLKNEKIQSYFGIFDSTADGAYTTKHPPNLKGMPVLAVEMDESCQNRKGKVHVEGTRITALTMSTEMKPKTLGTLYSKATVRSETPHRHVVQIGRSQQIELSSFLPLQMSTVKLQPGSTKRMVTVTGETAQKPDWDASLSNPTYLDASGTPVTWASTSVDPDVLPVIDISQTHKLKWVNDHLVAMFANGKSSFVDKTKPQWLSSSERELTLNSKEIRENMTMTIELLFRKIIEPGVPKDKKSVFALADKETRKVHLLLLISSMRWDLSSASPLLDIAYLSLTNSHKDKSIHKHLSQLQDTATRIYTNSQELRQWQFLIPSLVERCRTWQHRPDCEYKAAGRIPLSDKVGEEFLCSCGRGKFPGGYLGHVEGWRGAEEAGVRMALAPWVLFAVPEEGRRRIFSVRARKVKYLSVGVGLLAAAYWAGLVPV